MDPVIYYDHPLKQCQGHWRFQGRWWLGVPLTPPPPHTRTFFVYVDYVVLPSG